jgi:phosphoribosylformimino-5-aminoimidazole carboxamide ribotide isomerase
LAAIALYPAVDILDGKAVRLEQGDFERRREYSEDPLEAARRWAGEGARFLHVVDLDGARSGAPVNLERLRAIVSELRDSFDLVQYGGGLRSRQSAQAALAAGADRVVIGTAAFRDPPLLEALLAEHGDRIAVGLDVKGGKVALHGWQEAVDLTPEFAAAGLAAAGVRAIVHTSVDRDGTLEGPDGDGLRTVSGVLAEAGHDCELICSGGIGRLDDLALVADLDLPNVTGVIVGKALYEGRFELDEAKQALAGALGDRARDAGPPEGA